MSEMPIVAFADGAAKGNPGPGGWGVVVVAPSGEVTELAGRVAHTTNNRMELTAVIEALRWVRETPGPVAMHTDSTYVIRGIREWIHAWRRRGWKTIEGKNVVNRDLWEELAALTTARGAAGKVEWHYVRGHSGIPGNERVDEIAEGNAAGRPPELYRGPLVRYGVAVMDIPEDTRTPTRGSAGSSRAKTKTPAYSYLSLVDGRPMRHATWDECRQRVERRPGAKHKRAATAADEREILRSWGVTEDL